MTTPVIRTRALAKSFGETAAVIRLDLEIFKGEMFGLVGPDGGGKSTTIRLLCGLLRPTGGEARVLGFDLVREPAKVKTRIGYLSQNFTLYGDLTVDENIAFFARLHGVNRFQERRDELLEFTRLTPFRRRLAGNLSGGMKKKLALACTLIHTPELIFLDEPSTGVDPISRGEFWNILSRLLEEGVTIFLTTPYLDEAERCHRISLIHRGKIIVTGTPGELKSAMPGSVYAADCPAPRAAYRALREKWSSANLVLYGDSFHLWTEGGDEEARDSSGWLDEQGLGPAEFKKVAPTLEDVFVALLGPHQGEER